MSRHYLLRISGVIFGLALAVNAAAGDVVVIVAPDAPSLTKQQVTNIYLGRDLDHKPVDLPEGSPAHEAFYSKATDRNPAQLKAMWSRLVFTGHAQAPRVLADAAAVKKAVAADPKSVGYIDKADVDSTVKVLLTLN